MGLSPHICTSLDIYAYLSAVYGESFTVIACCVSSYCLTKTACEKPFISHPSLPRHNSPENKVSDARRATPQDSSEVFHKTACVAPSSSVLGNTSKVKLAVCHHSVLRSPTPRLIFSVPTSSSITSTSGNLGASLRDCGVQLMSFYSVYQPKYYGASLREAVIYTERTTCPNPLLCTLLTCVHQNS